MSSTVQNTTAAGASAAAASQTTTAAPKSDVTTDKFLQLLVAQMKNQDPMNPADGTQFLTQLAQFSQLEQLTGMRSDLQSLATELKPVSTSTTGDKNVNA